MRLSKRSRPNAHNEHLSNPSTFNIEGKNPLDLLHEIIVDEGFDCREDAFDSLNVGKCRCRHVAVRLLEWQKKETENRKTMFAERRNVPTILANAQWGAAKALGVHIALSGLVNIAHNNKLDNLTWNFVLLSCTDEYFTVCQQKPPVFTAPAESTATERERSQFQRTFLVH